MKCLSPSALSDLQKCQRIVSMWLWLLLLLVLLTCLKHLYESSRFPPGPLRLPLIGTWEIARGRLYGSRLILKTTEMIPKMGKVVGYFAGPFIKYAKVIVRSCTLCTAIYFHSMIIINDFDLIKECAFDPRFSNRPQGYFEHYVRGEGGQATGIVATSGEVWKGNRRFSLATLKGKLRDFF